MSYILHSLTHASCSLQLLTVQDDRIVILIVVLSSSDEIDMIAVYHAHSFINSSRTTITHKHPNVHTWISLLGKELLIGTPRPKRHRHIGQASNRLPIGCIAALAIRSRCSAHVFLYLADNLPARR